MRTSKRQAICKCIQILYSRFAILLLIILIRQSPLFAFNHPEIQWKSVSTRHFNIHFYDKTEPAVYAAWKIAEEAYVVFDSLYHYDARYKIHLALADYDDYSNGFAAWTQRTIMVFLPDAIFDLRSNTTWLRNVITHELAHIMSMEKKKRMQLLDWTLAFQYKSPNVNVTYGEPFALTTFFPMWFAEGTAQVRAEQMGSECWDNRRDMVLRCAAVDNKMLSLDGMGHFTHNIIGNEMVYNQGYSFTKYLENKIGRLKVAQVWNDNRKRKFFGTTLKRYLNRTFNISLDEMFKNWKDSLRSVYGAEAPADKPHITSVWEKGTMNAIPKISPDGRYWGWLTNHKDDFNRTDLIIANYGKNSPIVRIKYAQTDWDFSPDGNTIYYIKSRKPNRKGSYLNDIFSYSLKEGKENRLTTSARIYAITASTDQLVCVQYMENSFSLMLFSISSRKFNTIADGVPGEPFLSASFLPSNSNKLIVSKIVQGKAGLFKLDINEGVLEPLVSTEAQEEGPCCGQNGRVYFSADYDGVFNIYSLLPDGSDMQRHTSVIGGAFSPAFDKNGKLLISEYTSNGFRIAQCEADGVPYEIPNNPVCLFEPLPTPKGRVRIKAQEYQPKLLRPTWEILTSLICTDTDKALQRRIGKGAFGDSLWNINLDFSTQISMFKSDAVGQKEMYMGGAIVVSAGWDSDNSTTANNSYKRFTDVSADISRAQYNARPGFMRRLDQKRYGIVSPTLIRDIRLANAADDSDDDSGAVDESVWSIPLLIPFLGIENRTRKPIIGLDVQVALFMLIPAIIYLDPYIELHISRDLYMGISSSFSIMPILLIAGEKAGFALSLPLWVRWIYGRYFNEDIYYNMAGVTSLGGYVGPDIIPYIRIEDSFEGVDSSIVSDTTIETVTSLSFGVNFMHAFPLLKYASFSISTENNGMKFNKKISADLNNADLNGADSVELSFLLTSSNIAAFIFPIIRNINRGRLYADNLYGKLFYQLDFSGTEEFFSNPRADLFTNKEYSTDYALVSHRIGAGIDFGLIKNYIFTRDFQVAVSWDIFCEEINVDMSMWF